VGGNVCLPLFLLWRNFAKKRNLENKKFEKELILQSPESEKTKG
jgi:RNAse (barnase) inhibitor barstar